MPLVEDLLILPPGGGSEGESLLCGKYISCHSQELHCGGAELEVSKAHLQCKNVSFWSKRKLK